MSQLIEVSALELWYRRNIKLVQWVFGALLIVGAGYSVYKLRRTAQIQEASSLLANVQTAVSEHDDVVLQGNAERLKTVYPDTHQASFAMLQLARAQAEKQQWQASEQSARWVIEHTQLPVLGDEARIHLAHLQIQDKKWDAALATLNAPVSEEALKPIVDELIADVFAIKGSIEGARSHYQKALAAHPRGDASRDLIEYKLNSLVP
jgi:predicted negative regulator of RcsB-dependent stress response